MEMDSSNDLNFSKIPPYQRRKFVPVNADLSDVGQVVALYNKLYERDINSVEQLESFLLDRSELDATLHQQGAVLYIRMTCQTDDPTRVEAYKNFIETILPAVKTLTDKLDRKYIEARGKYAVDEKSYEVYDRNIKADIELFRQENVSLQTQDNLLSQEYQTICGKMTVEFNGLEYTMPQMHKLQEETDRELREKAWQAMTGRYLQDADRLDELFDKMRGVRVQIAKNAGFDNYREYKFKQYHRFDYTANNCKEYHQTVEDLVVPVLGEIRKNKAQKMGLDMLRPWDLSVDEMGREPLRPFETVDEFINGAQTTFNNIDPELGGQFEQMADIGLLDLASRKGKAPGGYQETLAEARKPFIFANAVGTYYDVLTLMHEAGHAFHVLACAEQTLFPYRDPPTEFAEVASMSIEFFSLPYMSVFYNDADAKRSYIYQLEGVIKLLTAVAAVDSFQHWIYENPECDVKELAGKYLQIYEKFSGKCVDLSGLEKKVGYRWHGILHIFECPFYYIEYGISQLGALGLWLQSKKDFDGTLANYRKALALGGSRSLPELFAAAGLEFDFSEKTIAPLVDAVVQELARLR